MLNAFRRRPVSWRPGRMLAAGAVSIAAFSLSLLIDPDPAALTVKGLSVQEAQARIGRPLTPVSYAGVARRTTRRVVRRSTAYVSTLPAGCRQVVVEGTSLWQCGATYYQTSGAQYVLVTVE